MALRFGWVVLVVWYEVRDDKTMRLKHLRQQLTGRSERYEPYSVWCTDLFQVLQLTLKLPVPRLYPAPHLWRSHPYSRRHHR